MMIFCLNLAPIVKAAEGEIDAMRLYKKSCRKCHDSDGSGKTPAGKKVRAKDYTKAEVQAQFTDEEAIKLIREGSTDENGKELMEGYPDFSDDEVKALVALVRSFAKAE